MERIDEQLNLNDLPKEILVYIFSFLNIKDRIKIERVCKKWRLIGTTIHWKIIEIKYKDRSNIDLTDYTLEEILKRCGNSVFVIDLIHRSRLTSKALSIIGDHCPNLRSVKFSEMCLTDSDLEYFSSKITKLKEAVLNGSTYGEDGLISFFKSCQELEVLHIEDNNNISGLCFQFISPKLKKLVFGFCTKLTPEGFLQLGKCKCIEHLELNYCRGLGSSSVKKVLKQICNSLKHLGLNGCIRPETLPFELLTKLESISCKHNHSIEDDTLLQIAHKCKNFRTLDVSRTNITDVGIKHLTICPSLTTLDVSYVKKITDESIIPLALVGKLESLTIKRNGNITDNACDTLAVHCTKLRYLDLSGCRGITDATAHRFINVMKLSNDGQRKLKIIAWDTRIRVSIEEEEFIIINK